MTGFVELAEVAIVGTSRAEPPPEDLGDPAERLVAAVPGAAPERALLLRLGAAAVRARAGRLPAAAGPLPPPAPPEARPACADRLAALVLELCAARDKPLVAEALALLDARGLRLPPAAVPALAALADRALLPAAARVAGARGRWLAAQNPAWRWLGDAPPPDPAARRRAWEEGATEARLAAFRAQRALDPGAARGWLDEVWQTEKAALREELVRVLAEGLSLEDEPALERARADRAAGVRAAAVRLLARLEGSALAARMRARAESMVSAGAAPAGVLGALRAKFAHGPAGGLVVAPPLAFPADWAGDGLAPKPPAGVGERAFWLRQVLAHVPPSHWERRFAAPPEALVAAATRTDWTVPLMAGWIDAATLFSDARWAAALWANAAAQGAPPEALAGLAEALFPIMDRAAREAAALRPIEAAPFALVARILPALPGPWSPALAGALLARLRRAAAGGVDWQEAGALRACLDRAGHALPPERFAEALAIEVGVPDVAAGHLRAGFDAFHAVLATRHRLHEETRS